MRRLVTARLALAAGACLAAAAAAGAGADTAAGPAGPLPEAPPAAPDRGDPAFESGRFVGPAVCARCHDDLRDGRGRDVSIVTAWAGTPMANAARDPIWRAKLRSEVRRSPAVAAAVEEKCSRCHAPMASVEARAAGQPVRALAGGFLAPAHPLHDAALGGVGCTLCHQIQAEGLGEEASLGGGYRIGEDRLIFGPFPEPFARPMVRHTGYEPVHAPHVRSSALCATCHEVRTPTVDAQGSVRPLAGRGGFPEQTPYTEWAHSAFASAGAATSCQDCHLPRTDGVQVSRMPPWLQARDGFGEHQLVGANRLLLDILRTHADQLGADAAPIAGKLASAQAMVESAGGLRAGEARLDGEGLRFTLLVASSTGHKLPTGFPSRRVVLHVAVRDAAGRLVFESGRVEADGGVAGDDARAPGVYEPHHDLITSPDQAQIYEAVLGDAGGRPTHTLLRAAAYLKDNRLLPAGFDKATAPAEVRVVGGALSDPDFTGGGDAVHFRIAGLAGASYRVEAELLHQPLSQPFAADLLAEDTPESADLARMVAASPARSTRLDAVSFDVAR